MSELRARLRIDGDARGAVQAAQAADRALEGVGAKGRVAQGGLNSAASGADQFGRSAGGARTAATGLATALAAVGFREIAQNMTDAALKAQGFQTGLSAVAGGASGAAAETGFLRVESERLGLVVNDQVGRFMSLAGATNGTALAGEETREIWLGLVEAGVALNRSAEQQGRAMEAVSQIASKGVVAMEEVRGQLAEAIPGATQIAARAMGMTSGAFIELVSSGKLLAEDFLPKFAQQLRSEFGPAIDAQMITPLGQARREMAATATGIFDLNAAAGEGFLSAAVEGMAAFNDEIQDPETLEAARALGETMGAAFGTAAEAAAFLVDHIELVGAAAGALTTVALARYLAGVTTGALASVGALRAKALATQAAAAANVAAIQAEISASAAMVASTTQTQRLAAAKLELAAANHAAAPAILGMKSAASGLLGLLGGPWGVAFAAAGGAVWLLTDHLAKARSEGLAFEERSRQIAQALAEAEAAGVSAADAMAGLATEAGQAVKPSDDLAYSLAGLGDKFAYVAAQAKTAQVNTLLARHAMAQADVADLEKEAERTRSRSMSLLAASAGEAGLPADIAAEARASMVDDPAVAALDAKLAQRRDEAARLAAAAQGAMATPAAAFATAEAHSTVAQAADDRAKKTDAAREAERRLARAQDLTQRMTLDIQLLQERAVAAVQGEAALEALAVREAGLNVLRDLGVVSLGELTGAEREAAAAAIAAAEAREREAIATDKVVRVAGATRDLDRRIAAERARTAAIEGGIGAMLAWEKEEFVRQVLEREGATLTAEQIALLREKAELLYDTQVLGDLAAANDERQRELDLARMTNREREIEQRALEIRRRNQIEFNGLTEDEAQLRAKILALRELEEDEAARAIGSLREGLRQAFIESGELGFDQVADYAERRLREAVFDALLAEPIKVMIEAVVGEVTGLSQAIGGLKGSKLGLLLGNTMIGQSLGSAIGQSMGLGSGNQNLDLGLSTAGAMAGSAVAGSMAGGWLGAGAANLATSLGASTAMAAGVGSLMMSAAVLGPLGAIAGLALGSLFKDDKRPYARADIGVVNGQFAVTGGQELDNGPLSEMSQAAGAISQSLNAAAELFKLDLTKFDGPTSIGYVQGKNTGALGQGYFGGDGGGFSTGAQFFGHQDPETLAAEIVRATIIRAIEAGASDLSEAEKRVVLQAQNLEEAANKIALGRSLVETIDEAILQITDPAAFERKKALEAIEESYQALKTQAEELVAAGLVSGDVLGKLEDLRDLQIDAALKRLGEAADSASDALERAAGLQGSIQTRILELVDPQAARASKVEAEIAAMRAQAEALIAEGAMSPDVLQQLEVLRQLELANAFGELDAALGRTTDAFAQLRPRLQQWLDQLGMSASAELSPQAQRDEALRQYQQVVAAARGGDADAASNYTAYADRLLSADRDATLSAQDRLALYNQVRADGEALMGMSGAAAASGPRTAIAGMEQLQTLLTQISFNTAPLALSAANDATAQPVNLVNLPALGSLYADALSPQTDRHLAALAELRGAIVDVLDRHHGVLTANMQALRAAAEALPAALDEGLAGVQAAVGGLVSQTAELADETRLGNAHLRAVMYR
ncbi:tape measure protein [Phenylobacterium sp.]|uniref:tape measure protein n=1 Tax=Phenylobacterium sp. TaxID=1871053 RepID=UPI002730BD6D|nr:tape measure protein [Phenylobacterium sp.]MDP1617491.1 tape measure protein [Phenylobacterium sp.]